MKPQSGDKGLNSGHLIRRLTHINQFLEWVFGEPLRLDDLLHRSGMSPTDVESIKRNHLMVPGTALQN